MKHKTQPKNETQTTYVGWLKKKSRTKHCKIPQIVIYQLNHQMYGYYMFMDRHKLHICQIKTLSSKEVYIK